MEIIKLRSRLSSEERESHLNKDCQTRTWQLDTTILKDYNKAVKQKWKMIKQYVYADDGSIAGGVFEAPERSVTFRSTDKKQMSDKQMHNLDNDDED